MIRATIALIAAVAATAQPQGTGIISGRVVFNNEPVRKVVVTLEWHGTPASKAVSITDRDGNFLFDQLPPGNYTIDAARAGYLDARYPTRGRMELAAGEKSTGIQLMLGRGASVSGVVVTVDGAPIASAEVQLIRVSNTGNGSPSAWSLVAYESPWTQSLQSVKTNDRGEYRFTLLTPGIYAVRAGLKESVNRIQVGSLVIADRFSYQFYRGAQDWSRATTLTVRSGDVVRGIDFRLSPMRVVPLRGRVSGVPGGDKSTRSVEVLIKEASGMGRFRYVSAKPPDYQFEVTDTEPGLYQLTASEWIGGKSYYSGQRLELTVDSTAVELTLKPAVDLKGQILVDDGVLDLSTAEIALQPTDSNAALNFPRVRPGSDGKFTFEQIPAGTWTISVTLNASDGFVKSITLGEKPVISDEIDVVPGMDDRLIISMSARGARLEVKLADPLPESSAVLIPISKQTSAKRRSKTIDTDGPTTIRGIAPGSYLLLVLDPEAMLDLRRDDLVRRFNTLGQTIEAREGSRITVEPVVVTATQVREALK